MVIIMMKDQFTYGIEIDSCQSYVFDWCRFRRGELVSKPKISRRNVEKLCCNLEICHSKPIKWIICFSPMLLKVFFSIEET